MKIAALVYRAACFLGNDLFMDILYNCAEAYKQLMCNEYHIKFFVDNEIKEMNLTFSKSEFKHLTGLEKLKDKTLIHDLSSSTLLDYIHNHRIVYDSSLYANSPDVEISEQIIDSQYLNNPINNTNKSNIAYNLIDRINELTNLYNLLHSASNNSLSVFKWNGDFPKEKRPNYSDIKADLLLVFDNSVTQKAPDETVCSFFIEEQDGKAAAVSIFPTNLSYSDDGVVPPLHQCKILFFEEHNISPLQQNVVVTPLINCTSEELKVCEQIDKEEKRNRLIKSKLYGLNDTRKKFLKCLKRKFDINENIEYKSEFSKYQTRLEEIATSPKIDIEAKRKIVDEIQKLRDKTDSNERLKLDSLDDEIRIINDSIERKIELSQKISQDIHSPVAALSSASLYPSNPPRLQQ